MTFFTWPFKDILIKNFELNCNSAGDTGKSINLRDSIHGLNHSNRTTFSILICIFLLRPFTFFLRRLSQMSVAKPLDRALRGARQSNHRVALPNRFSDAEVRLIFRKSAGARIADMIPSRSSRTFHYAKCRGKKTAVRKMRIKVGVIA